jgi:hypothetical protein
MTTFAIYRNAISNLGQQYTRIAQLSTQLVDNTINQGSQAEYERLDSLRREAWDNAAIAVRNYVAIFTDPVAMRMGQIAERNAGIRRTGPHQDRTS